MLRLNFCLFLAIIFLIDAEAKITSNTLFNITKSEKLKNEHRARSDRIKFSKPIKYFGNYKTTGIIDVNGYMYLLSDGETSSAPNWNSCEIVSGFNGIILFLNVMNITNGGNIYYKQSNQTEDLLKAKREIARAFPETYLTSIEYIFTVTYHKVNPGYSSKTFKDANKQNTIQLTLAVDSKHNTFTIFNFEKLEWDRSNYSNTLPAIVGFGTGHEFLPLKGSCTKNVLQLSLLSNVDVPGIWIYKVSNEIVESPTSSTILNQIQIFINLSKKFDEEISALNQTIETVLLSKIDAEKELNECKKMKFAENNEIISLKNFIEDILEKKMENLRKEFVNELQGIKSFFENEIENFRKDRNEENNKFFVD